MLPRLLLAALLTLLLISPSAHAATTYCVGTSCEGFTKPTIDAALTAAAANPGKDVFRAVIVAPESGELFLFSNDAAVFGWRRFFYDNNCGTALVVIRALDAAEEPPDGTFSVGSLPEDVPVLQRCAARR